MSSGLPSLLTKVSSLTEVKSSLLSSFAFILYDHVITFDAEVMRVWKHPWSLGKVLFLWTRYFGLAVLVVLVSAFFHPSLSDMSCERVLLFAIVSSDILYISIEAIMLVRLYAAYELNRTLIIILTGICFFAGIGGPVMAIFFRPKTIAMPPVFHLSGCADKLTSITFGYCLVPAMVAEIILCFCMVYKAWSAQKYEPVAPMLRLLVKDSVLYFSSIFAMLLINSLLWVLAPQAFKFAAFGWIYAIYSAMGCRLLLNIFEQPFRRKNLKSFLCSSHC